MEPRPDQLTVCTKHCGARCCQHVTVPVRAPRSENDWDEMRWWLAHGGVLVTKDEDGWRVHVETRCGHLRDDNACEVYAHRPRACAEYDPTTCEYTGPLE